MVASNTAYQKGSSRDSIERFVIEWSFDLSFLMLSTFLYDKNVMHHSKYLKMKLRIIILVQLEWLPIY